MSPQLAPSSLACPLEESADCCDVCASLHPSVCRFSLSSPDPPSPSEAGSAPERDVSAREGEIARDQGTRDETATGEEGNQQANPFLRNRPPSETSVGVAGYGKREEEKEGEITDSDAAPRFLQQKQTHKHKHTVLSRRRTAASARLVLSTRVTGRQDARQRERRAEEREEGGKEEGARERLWQPESTKVISRSSLALSGSRFSLS